MTVPGGYISASRGELALSGDTSTSSSGSTGTPSIPSLHRDQSWTAYCLRSRDSCKDLGTLTAINRASMKMTPNGKSSSAGTPSESVFTPSPPPQSTNPTSRSYYSALRARKRELDEHLVSRSSSVQATNGSGSDIEAKKRKRRRDADLELQRQRDMDLAGLIGTVTKEDYGSSVKPPRSSRSSRPRSRTEVIQVVQVHEPEGQPREFSIETSAQNLGLGHRQRSFSMINDPQESEEVSEETQQGAGNSWLLWTWLLALLLFAVFLAVCGIMVYYEVVVARRVGGDHRRQSKLRRDVMLIGSLTLMVCLAGIARLSRRTLTETCLMLLVLLLFLNLRTEPEHIP